MLIVVLQAGLPTSFWLSGFFNHHSFIAAIKQNFARANNCSIDEVRRGVKAFVECNSGGFWVFGAGCWSRGIPSSLIQIFAKIYQSFTHKYICSHHYICTNQCICTYLDICILLNICKHPLIHQDIQVGQGEVAVHGLSLEGAQWDEVYSSTLHFSSDCCCWQIMLMEWLLQVEGELAESSPRQQYVSSLIFSQIIVIVTITIIAMIIIVMGVKCFNTRYAPLPPVKLQPCQAKHAEEVWKTWIPLIIMRMRITLTIFIVVIIILMIMMTMVIINSMIWRW